jgi:hypothetical protein
MTVVPSKFKTYVALAGSILSFVVPLIVSVENYLPAPWPAVIGGVIALLTAAGVYKAPYVPPGATVVPTSVAQSLPPAAGEFKNPWQ